jgi:hypothetical protein
VAILDFQKVQKVTAEISKIFFSDTTWRMELEIVMNDHCKLLTKCCYFLDRLKIQESPPLVAILDFQKVQKVTTLG